MTMTTETPATTQENKAPTTQGAAPTARTGGGAPQQGGDRRRNERRPRRARPERARSEFEHKIVSIRRVTRVVAGGRRFGFSVSLVAGDGRGQVGVGLGKASDTALAIEKALQDAKRNMVKVAVTDDASIPHEANVKYASSHILLIPAPGKGLKAGSAVRTVLELAGIKHVSGKIISRSKNHLNNARATVLALSELKQKKTKKKVEAKKETPKTKEAEETKSEK